MKSQEGIGAIGGREVGGRGYSCSVENFAASLGIGHAFFSKVLEYRSPRFHSKNKGFMPESKMPRLHSSLLAEAADLLVRLIPPQVRSLNIGETVYSLRIWYHGSDSFTSDWTPWLMLPKESVRQQALALK
jgi:hypothetical protein